MQKVVEVKYVTVTGHPAQSGGLAGLLARLTSDVNRQLQDGWVLNGGVTVYGKFHDTTVVQPMVKYETAEQQQLPVRR